MPKKRIKSSGNITKSGLLNSSYKKLSRKKESIAGKYFQIKTTPVQSDFTGHDYFNDANTYVFEEKTGVNNILGVTVVPLANDPNKFYITSDEKIRADGVVLAEYENTLNSNYFVNNNLIDTPNELSLQAFNSTSSRKENNQIFEELNENTKQEVYKPFVDNILEEKFSNEFISNTIYDDENYYLGDQTSFVIELDFSNESDCQLVNTLLLSRNNDLPNDNINSIDDSTSFNNQFNFTGSNSYSITSNFLTNSYWNNNLKRWEYNLDDSEYHVNSFKVNSDITFPNSITHNYNGTVDDTNTINHLYTFLDRFISKSFITHSPYYDRFNYLKDNTRNQKFNKLTETYGFPYNKRWNPNKDHLISLKDYIAREFLLEKVVFEGKISAKSEIPVYTGNIETVSTENDFNNEKLITLNKSEYNIVGANFYLLKSETLKENGQKIKPVSPYGFRVKKDTDTQTISQYTGEINESYLDNNFSDLNSPLKFDRLKGDFTEVNNVILNINGTEDSLVFDSIQSSIITQLEIDEENNNIVEIDNSSFYYLENLSDNESINTQNNSYLIYSTPSSVLNYNIYSNSIDNETQFKKKFTKTTSEKLNSKKELITESSIFFGKTKLNSDISFEDYNGLTVLDASDDLLIDVEERRFSTFNTCFSRDINNNVSESNFSCISNLFQGQTIPQVNIIKRLLISNREMLQLFDAVVQNYSNIRDEDNSLYFESSESNFSLFADPATYLPDFIIFSDASGEVIDPNIKALSLFTSNGINFRFKHEESLDNTYTLGDILTYDVANDINYINTAILGNDAYCAKYRQIRNITEDKTEISLIDLGHEPGNIAGNLFNILSTTEKRSLFINLILFGIYFSKINHFGSPIHLIEKITFIEEEINYMSYDVEFLDNTFDESKKYIHVPNDFTITKVDLNENINYGNKFGSILFERTLTDLVQDFSAESIDTTSESILIDEISIVEGNEVSIKNDSRLLNNISNKDESETNIVSSRSGKILSSDVRHQSKNFSYILKPEDDIIVGISSFSNFNTTASHIKFHDKIKITLYGKEIKEVKKNESSQSTNIKKVFVGNNTLQSIEEGKTSFNKENLSISSSIYLKSLLADSIFPGAVSIHHDILGLTRETFRKDANDIYNSFNNSVKIIVSDKFTTDDIASLPQNVSIIKDWHEKFYISINKEKFDDKRFYSDVPSTFPVNLYYDEQSYSINNDYFYNNVTVDLENELENRYDFFTIKDLFLPTESIEITTEVVSNNTVIIVNDYSTKGILPTYNTNIKFVPEDNLYSVNFENHETILPEFSSLQFLKIPVEFYIQNDMFKFKKRNANLLRYQNIPSWCLVIELDEDSASDLYVKMISFFKEGFRNTNIPQEYFDFYKIGTNEQCVFKKNKKVSIQIIEDDGIIDRDFYLVAKSDNKKTIQIIVPFRHSEIFALNGDNALNGSDAVNSDDHSYTYNIINYTSSNNFTDLSNENPKIARLEEFIIGKLDIAKFVDVNSENIVLNDTFPLTLLEMRNSDIDFDDNIITTAFNIKESSYELSHTENKKDVIYNEYQFENMPINSSEFIKNNNLTLIQKNILSDSDYANKKLKEFTKNGYNIEIKDNVYYYTPFIYKKRGNYFVNTGIKAIFTIKNDIYAFETSHLNLLGVIYNNRILNTNYLSKSQYLIGINESDVIRIYENASEKVYNINDKIQKNYFELDFSTTNENGNQKIILMPKSYKRIEIVDNSLTSFGTPIVSNIQRPENSLVAKSFFYGYRKTRKFKYPIDKFDGYRYGVLELNPVEFSYLVNKNHFGQFKDLKYDTQNYSRVLYGKNKEIIEQHCVEKEYYDEYFNQITKDIASERALFVGTNMDKYARSYYPFIESNTSEDNSDMQSLYT